MEKTLSLNCLEFSKNRWKYKPELLLLAKPWFFTQFLNQPMLKCRSMFKPGLFFHRFLLNSRQFKLKVFSKLKNVSLNSSEFHILTQKSDNFRECLVQNCSLYYTTAKIYICPLSFFLTKLRDFPTKLKDIHPKLKNPGNPFAGNDKKSVKK